jgi:2-succinyl-6-hydroxy-2,4-cyclohexadiene-1-carboxylate synthase
MELSAVATGEGPPLVLLHGFTGNCTSWEEWLPELEKRYRVLAVDLPGHGNTKFGDADLAADLPYVAAAIDRLLEKQGIGKAAFIGYSMGGRALLHLAALFPHRISSMVILSASPGIEDSTERAIRARADDALADRLESEGLETFVTEWMAQPLFETLSRAEPGRVSREKTRKLSGDGRAFAQALRQLTPGRQPSLWHALARMELPCLIVSGELDQKYVDIASRMVVSMPNARGAVIAGAGHALLLENPAATGAAVAAFHAEQEVS